MRVLVALALVAAPLMAQAPAQQWEPYSAGLQSRAAGGDATAQFVLGEAFRTGNGIGADREQAITWYRKAADRDPRAADALGVLLFTKGERKQAIPLLQAAAGRRNDYALYILGTARFNGDYVPKDLARAYSDMRIAAMTLPQAQRSLALMEAYVTPIDRQRADQLVAQPGGPEAGAPAAPAHALTPPPALTRPTQAPGVSRPSIPLAGSTTSPGSPAISGPTLPPPPPSAVPSVAAPASKVAPSSSAVTGWRVQLGAYSSEARAASQWTILAAKVPALARLRKATQPAGSLVRLQAIGLASRDEATALCRSITAASGPCLVLAPGP